MKVNDYVRYKKPFERKETIMIGKILRIYEPDEKHKIKGYDLDTSDVISDEFSIKSSPNIIDLIEVGDYANGSLVEFSGTITWDKDMKPITKAIKVKQGGYDVFLNNENIKSIVTHEQFSQMEYKIGE